MKSLLNKFYYLLTYKSDNFNIVNSRILSKRSIRILIWVRIISRIYMWLLALYLIANFAAYLRRILLH